MFLIVKFLVCTGSKTASRKWGTRPDNGRKGKGNCCCRGYANWEQRQSTGRFAGLSQSENIDMVSTANTLGASQSSGSHQRWRSRKERERTSKEKETKGWSSGRKIHNCWTRRRTEKNREKDQSSNSSGWHVCARKPFEAGCIHSAVLRCEKYNHIHLFTDIWLFVWGACKDKGIRSPWTCCSWRLVGKGQKIVLPTTKPGGDETCISQRHHQVHWDQILSVPWFCQKHHEPFFG